MKKMKRMSNRIFSLFLAFFMLCTMQDMTAFAQTADTAVPQAQAELSTGETISFGSYPQTEVKGSALTDAIVNASYDSNGDAVVDGQRYRRYKEAVLQVTKEDYQAYVQEYHADDRNYANEMYWNGYYNQYWNSAYLEECEKKAEQQDYRYFKWEPIEWKVLENETEEGTLFVMAKTVLDAVNYHGEYSNTNEYPETV